MPSKTYTKATDFVENRHPDDYIYVESPDAGRTKRILLDGLSTADGITASTTQSQGQQQLTAAVNTISTVANADDVVTLPEASIGRVCHVKNAGVNTLQVYPASGDQIDDQAADLPTTQVAGRSVLYVSTSASRWEKFTTTEAEVLVSQAEIINGGSEDEAAWQATLAGRRAAGEAIAKAATFVAYSSGNTVADAASTTSGAVAWTEDAGAGNEWRGGSTGLTILRSPAAGNGEAMRTTITGLTEGQRYSIWACVLHSGAATDNFGLFCPFGVTRGEQNDFYEYYYGEDNAIVKDWVFDVEDGNIDAGAATGRMLFMGNYTADRGGQVTFTFEDTSGADRLNFAGAAYGTPMPEHDDPKLMYVAQRGIWSWWHNPGAIVLADGNYLIGSVTPAGDSVSIYYNPSSGAMTESILQAFAEMDDHNAPAFVETDDSKVMAFYSKHSTDTKIWRNKSSNATPTTAGHWQAAISINTSWDATYAQVFKMSNGDIYWFFRMENQGWYYSLSTDDGATWGAAVAFMKHSVQSFPPYMKCAYDSVNDTIHCTATESPNVGDYESPLWHWTFDGTNIYNSDGTLVKAISAGILTPDTELSSASEIQAHDSTYGQLWVDHIVVDSDGYARITFNSFNNTNAMPSLDRTETDEIRLWYARYNGAGWDTAAVAFMGNGVNIKNSLYSGGSGIDPNRPDRIVIATNAYRPFDLDAPYEVGKRGEARDAGGTNVTSPHEVWIGERYGDSLNFKWRRVTLGTDPKLTNFRPFIATNAAGTTSVLFWLRGIYGADTTNPETLKYGHTSFEVLGLDLPL